MFLEKLMPNEFVQSVHHIDLAMLRERKIRAIITDLDNTLVEWNRPEATPEIVEWFRRLHEAGIQVTVVSNNRRERVLRFCQPLGCRYIHTARKPAGPAFLRAVREMGVAIEETAVVGDQLFTDVLGGNRLGFYTILVVPVSASDGFWTRFNRKLEKLALCWMRKRGMISWKNNNA